MFDKMVNHLVARFILLPSIMPCVIDTNVASRVNKGTDAGLKYYFNFRRICDIRNDFDHFVKEELKIKYYVRYQDDFLLFHESKEYLKECLEKVKEYLKNEKLKLNSKTRIYNNKSNFIFLGRDKKGKYAKYRLVKRKMKKRFYLYRNGEISLYSLLSSIDNFKKLGNIKM